MSKLLSLIENGAKPVVGMIQLKPLPGGSAYKDGGVDSIIEQALGDAQVLADHNFDALMVQNLGDLPVSGQVTASQTAWMTRVVTEIRRNVEQPVGLNFLENDATAMLAVASACGADFVRIKAYLGAMVTPFGIAVAQAHEAIRARTYLGVKHVAILADVHDRTSIPMATAGLLEDVLSAVRLGGADCVVLTGRSHEQTIEFISTAREAHPDIPILVGGGVSEENWAEISGIADGAVVSGSLKDSGAATGALDARKVQSFMAKVKKTKGINRE